MVGGLASARGGPGSNRLFLDGEVHAHGGVGLIVGGEIRTRTLVSHGCRPIGPPMTVTRAERNVLLELAGAPAALGGRRRVAGAAPARLQQPGRCSSEWSWTSTPTSTRADDFLVRGILGADEMTGAVAVGDVIEVGRTVRFQVRDAGSAAEDLGAALPAADPTPSGALLFSCKARRSLFARPDHDARVTCGTVRGGRAAGRGEIGPVGGYPPARQHRGLALG